MVRVKLPSYYATFENSKRKSTNKDELMRGRYGERISIYSEDLSDPTRENEFWFCTLHFYDQHNGIEHDNLFYSILTGNVRLLCPSLWKVGFPSQDRYQ